MVKGRCLNFSSKFVKNTIHTIQGTFSIPGVCNYNLLSLVRSLFFPQKVFVWILSYFPLLKASHDTELAYERHAPLSVILRRLCFLELVWVTDSWLRSPPGPLSLSFLFQLILGIRKMSSARKNSTKLCSKCSKKYLIKQQNVKR